MHSDVCETYGTTDLDAVHAGLMRGGVHDSLAGYAESRMRMPYSSF